VDAFEEFEMPDKIIVILTISKSAPQINQLNECNYSGTLPAE